MVNEFMTRVFISTKLVDTKTYPKIMREYFFLRGIMKYFKRKSIRQNEWRQILQKPPRVLGLNILFRALNTSHSRQFHAILH